MRQDKQSDRNRAYLFGRAAEEGRAATQAICDEARVIHHELARRYAAKARKTRSADAQPSNEARNREQEGAGS